MPINFDPKEHANWLVNHGVPEKALICPLCGGTGIKRAMDISALLHVANGEPILDPETGKQTGVNTAAVACANCGFLRLFVLDPEFLPEPEENLDLPEI